MTIHYLGCIYQITSKMNDQKWNNRLGWLVFALATSTYLLTAERTVSFWDCGEFIAAAYKLQIVHQPGAPLFLLLQNLFSNVALGNTAYIAWMMNLGSALCSGFTILFLFWTITALAKKISSINVQPQALLTAGLVGSLAYAFSDSFWFSAVETEVYAMSSLCTALVFWLALKWEARADQPRGDKYLLLIAYIMGLSIGVHLLNLLSIPVIGALIYLRKSKNVTRAGFLKTLALSATVLAAVLWGTIQYSTYLAGKMDIFFVNQTGLPGGSGLLIFLFLLSGGFAYFIRYSIRKARPVMNLILLGTLLIFFGFSSYAMVFLRAAAHPSLNNYNPSNAISFLDYLSRDQYVSNPLISGSYFDSRITGMEETQTYRKEADRYVPIEGRPRYQYDRTTLFPRIFSSDASRGHPAFYRSWLNLGENDQPRFGDNLNFFMTYQAGVMYARYFMWNFVGRQNEESGQMGNLTDGNWLSGIPALDNLRLGGQYELPDAQQNDPSRNTFFFLPLLLGIAGLIWQFSKDRKSAFLLALFFFFTGLAIVLYLNDTPLQPRERDYVYVGSFYVFAIWIGFGFLALYQCLERWMKSGKAFQVSALVALAVPLWMAYEGWDDHDRSSGTAARDLYARNYLESCERNAILFTRGDNDTFPLWYAQEVEGIRRDVRVVNIGYLDSDWYVEQQYHPINDAAPLPLSFNYDKVKKGVRDYVPFHDFRVNGPVELDLLLSIVLSDDRADQVQLQDGSYTNVLPTKRMRLPVNKEAVLASGTVPAAWQDEIADSLEWEFNQDYLTRGKMVVLDLIQNNQWKRPIYFVNMPSEDLMGLDKYFIHEGLVSKLMPVNYSGIARKEGLSDDSLLNNPEALRKNLVERFQYASVREQKHLDPLTKNMLPMLTAEFANLSQHFLDEKQDEKAREVALKAFAVLPEKPVSLSQSGPLYFLSDSLYKLQETEKANQLTAENGEYVSQQLNYYLAIAETKPNYEMRNIQYGVQVLNALVENTALHGQKTLNERLKNNLAAIENRMRKVML